MDHSLWGSCWSVPHYPFDNAAPQAGDRFASLAKLYDGVTRRHLDRFGIGAGQRCLEVGAGGGSVARFMSERVGPDALVAPELAVVVEPDAERAREDARAYAATYLGLSNYTSNLLRYGFTEADVADGGSDRLIDAVVAHGTAEQIAAAVHEHLEAGADHVCLQPVGHGTEPLDDYRALAAALL